jgi:hypothetical protein
MLWGMKKKKKIDPVAYAAKVRKEAERMQAMSEAFGSHEPIPTERESKTAARRVKKS